MRIGLDLSITHVNQAGTSIYAQTLVKALQQLTMEDDYIFFAVNQRRTMGEAKTWRSRLDTLYRDFVWMHMALPKQVTSHGVELLHMPANIVPIRQPCPTVVTILDTTVFQFPHSFPRWHRYYAHVFITFAARHAAHILTISEHSKLDILKQFAVAPDNVSVTHLAASEHFQPISEKGITDLKEHFKLDSFILAVGTLEPRKNMLRLLQAFAQLRKGGFTGSLVHVGPKGWLYDDVLAEINHLNLQDSVRFLGRVSLSDLVGLYNAAAVFVYPSLYEGFGIPILEAMACGCPVVTSNVSSLPEIAGDAALLVDPYNIEQLACAIQQLLEDQMLAERLRQRGYLRAAQFSWRRCAEETSAVYHRVAGL